MALVVIGGMVDLITIIVPRVGCEGVCARFTHMFSTIEVLQEPSGFMGVGTQTNTISQPLQQDAMSICVDRSFLNLS
tara:strand:- start:284 stop:514 length:231 start_codon:yes stop_codon:yes gene_type:complete